MRILLGHNKLYYPSYGGGDRSNRLLMAALAARGHACRVVARLGQFTAEDRQRLVADLAARSVGPVAEQQDAVAFELDGVEVRVVTSARLMRAFFVAEIKSFAPDVVLTSTDDPAQLLLGAALEAGPPRVAYLARTTLDAPFGPDSAFPDESKAALLRRVDGVVGVSEYVAAYFRKWGAIDAVHLPISLLEPGPYPALARYDNEFVTLVNPCAVKGISILLALADRMPAVRFAAVPTWGTNAGDLEELRRRPNIEILEPVDDVNRLFARTRVLLVPSLWAEARSRIIPEALLRGTPVLASNVGGIPEAMLGLDYVLPVRPIQRYWRQLDDRRVPVAQTPPQDIGPWQDALAGLLTDRGRYEALSAQSRARALAYAEGLSVEPFEQFLAGIVRRPARRAAPPVKTGAVAGLERLSEEKRRLLALRLRKKGAEAAPAAEWFPPASSSGSASFRLFCFPAAGGGAAAFRGWADRLPPGILVCPARLPGRESRLAEPPLRHMEPLVTALGEAIADYLDLPFALFGHSMGAVIAFELARLLRDRGKPAPAALLVSGARAPRFRLGHVPPPEPAPEEFLRELERLEGLPPELRVNQELLRVVLPALQADAALYRGYVYREAPPLACPIRAYGGTEDPNVTPAQLEVWRQETVGDFRMRLFPGGHFFLDTARDEFLAALSADLAPLLGD